MQNAIGGGRKSVARLESEGEMKARGSSGKRGLQQHQEFPQCPQGECLGLEHPPS
jgi:hypothetical protein